MKNLLPVMFVLALTSTLAFADGQRQQIECRVVKPSCSLLLSASSGSEDIIYNDVPAADFALKVSASMVRNPNANSSQMTITVKDSSGHSTRSYTINDNESFLGGIEDFAAANGKTYSILCDGARVADANTVKWADQCQ